MTIFDVASFVGTISFTLSGFYVGIRKHLDILGVTIAATLTALGGGIIRDVLVQRVPHALIDTQVILVVMITLLIAVLLKLGKKGDLEQRLMFVISDSAGLVAFSITGALIGLETHLSLFGVILLSFITAVGGGIMRDILVNDIPTILVSEFYGSVAILIALLIWSCDTLGLHGTPCILIIGVLGLSLRLLAYFYDWHLPKLGVKE